ncbi:transposase [Ralstonia solanacearum]|uniref:transposase n=1 Tax=Ralstonia solanacearum TaxID=305 RepID=UPI001E5191EE|nr:transposase [Ralstonia solanacearum]
MAQQEQLREPFAGSLECDETTFGGARHGKRGWGAAGKVVVFGIVKRNGEVKAAPIDQHDQAAIMDQIQAHTREGSLYYTDAWQAYATLRLRGDHVVVDFGIEPRKTFPSVAVACVSMPCQRW